MGQTETSGVFIARLQVRHGVLQDTAFDRPAETELNLSFRGSRVGIENGSDLYVSHSFRVCWLVLRALDQPLRGTQALVVARTETCEVE